MSSQHNDLTGSAARNHEQSGGNVPANRTNLPFAGDAARQAESDGDAVNAQHGVHTAPRGQFRSSAQLNLPRVSGARLTQPKAEAAGLSERKASDYLPPQLKAQLIAQGRLAEDGSPIPAPTTTCATPKSHPAQVEPQAPAAEAPKGFLASLGRFFANLFGSSR